VLIIRTLFAIVTEIYAIKVDPSKIHTTDQPVSAQEPPSSGLSKEAAPVPDF
jgi:hypothetical protein